MVCTWNGIEFVFNNQTVLVWLLFVETLCGIELCSFNKILHCIQIPLIVWSTRVKICLTGHLMDMSWTSHGSRTRLLGFAFALGFMFMTHNTI